MNSNIAFMRDILSEIERVLPSVTWRSISIEDTGIDIRTKPVGYAGTIGDWRFVAVSFGIEDQGFPKGTRGYDGAATKSGVVCRFTREIAERAFKLAQGN